MKLVSKAANRSLEEVANPPVRILKNDIKLVDFQRP